MFAQNTNICRGKNYEKIWLNLYVQQNTEITFVSFEEKQTIIVFTL